MRLPTRENPSAAELADAAAAEPFDALPAYARLPTAHRPPGWIWLAARLLGALAVLAVGGVHLYEFAHLYSQIPTIGTLFFLNFLGASAIGLGLLAPIQRIGGRHGTMLLVLLALAGIVLAVVAFAFLLISQQTALFGFQEPGYDPAGIDAVRAAEVATVIFLGAFLVARLVLEAPMRRW
jgi:hypothetical protein